MEKSPTAKTGSRLITKNGIKVEKGNKDNLQTGYSRGSFRALRSHICHHRQTPSTAARPSSLRSVPSGLPSTMAKIQKKAAVHTRRRNAMERSDESKRTAIKPKME